MPELSAFNLPYGAQLGATLVFPAGVGEVFYVCSTTGTDSSGGFGLTPSLPFKTIDFAIGLCTANKGATIFVLPGHVETLTASVTITCDVAGVTIIGLGNGSNRPKIVWSTTDSVLAISAADVTIQNIQTTVSIDEVVSMILVTGAGCTLDRVDFIPFGALGVTGQALQWLLTTNAADQLKIKNCVHRQQTAAASAQVWIQLVGVDSPRILDNAFHILANASTSSHLIHGSTLCVGFEIARNQCYFTGGTVNAIILFANSSLGVAAYNNFVGGSGTSATACYVSDTGHRIQNFWTTVATTAGASVTG